MINPHWLTDNSDKRELPVNFVIAKLYKAWKILLKKKNKESQTEIDAFATGYILGVNDSLKKRYLDEIKEVKRDLRIQNQLWK